MTTTYAVVTLDLTPVRSLHELVGPSTTVVSVTVLDFPAGLEAYIRLGQSGDKILVVAGLEITDICERGGVYYDQPNAAAGTARIAWFGMGGASLGG